MMKITGLSHLFKWENLHNWWLTKYFFAPLYMCKEVCVISNQMQIFMFSSLITSSNLYVIMIVRH